LIIKLIKTAQSSPSQSRLTTDSVRSVYSLYNVTELPVGGAGEAIISNQTSEIYDGLIS